MSRAATFRQAELAKAIRAVERGGKCVRTVNFPPEGGFSLLLGEPEPPVDVAQESGDDWSEAIAAL